MQTEIRHTFYLIGLGIALVAYAHANFSTKTMVIQIKDAQIRENDGIIKRLERIEQKIDSIKR